MTVCSRKSYILEEKHVIPVVQVKFVGTLQHLTVIFKKKTSHFEIRSVWEFLWSYNDRAGNWDICGYLKIAVILQKFRDLLPTEISDGHIWIPRDIFGHMGNFHIFPYKNVHQPALAQHPIPARSIQFQLTVVS